MTHFRSNATLCWSYFFQLAHYPHEVRIHLTFPLLMKLTGGPANTELVNITPPACCVESSSYN